MLLKNQLQREAWKRIIVFTIGWIWASCLLSAPALAHNVYIFAWIEGDTIFTESKFKGGKRVKNGKIGVFDAQGKLLLNGQTNDQGEFAFKIPAKTEMKIVLQAGMGHRGEWTIAAEEFETSSAETVQTPPPIESGPVNPSAPSQLPAGLTRKDLRIAVENALDKKLKPLFRMVAESRKQKTTLKDVLGGLGYIFGLMGVGAYYHFRRKNQ